MRIDARSAVLPIIGLTILWASAAGAQGTSDSVPKHHAPVCATGVRTYTSARDVPTPYETLSLPPGPPIRVTPGGDLAAADQAMRDRVGSGGATGMIVTESNDGGLLRRSVTPVFVPSDSARAHAACKS